MELSNNFKAPTPSEECHVTQNNDNQNCCDREPIDMQF